MKVLRRGQRVIVYMCGGECHGDQVIEFRGGAAGVVCRPRRCDDGAWVTLDRRSDITAAHPFPADDSRGRDVLAYPEGCDEPPSSTPESGSGTGAGT